MHKLVQELLENLNVTKFQQSIDHELCCLLESACASYVYMDVERCVHARKQTHTSSSQPGLPMLQRCRKTLYQAVLMKQCGMSSLLNSQRS